MQPSLFTEIGFDLDNNKYFLGVSTEIEDYNGKEVRKPGFVKMKIKGAYIRLWLLKLVIGIGIPEGFVLKKKSRNNFKLILGIVGILWNLIKSKITNFINSNFFYLFFNFYEKLDVNLFLIFLALMYYVFE